MLSHQDFKQPGTDRPIMTGLTYVARDPLRANIVEQYTELGWSPLKTNQHIRKVYGAILNFCWYETQGLVDEIFEIPGLVVDVPLATYDYEDNKLNWLLVQQRDIVELQMIKLFLDEQAICEPLKAVYNDYDKKLYYLARLYQDIYKAFRMTCAFMQSMDPSVHYPQLPTIEHAEEQKVLSKITRIAMHGFEHKTRLCTPAWENVREQRLTLEANKPTNSFFQKYFYSTYFPGSELNELLTVSCHIQELINQMYRHYFDKDIAPDIDAHRSRWRQFNSVICIEGVDPDNQRLLKLHYQYDAGNLRHLCEVHILNKILNLDSLHQYIINQRSTRTDDELACHYANLFYEAEHFIVQLEKSRFAKLDSIPPLKEMINNDFAATYLKTKIVQHAIYHANKDKDKNKIQKIIHDICLEADALTIIDHPTFIRTLKFLNADNATSITDKLTQPRRSPESIKYFDIDYLTTDYQSLETSEAKYLFMANLYISAKIFAMRIANPDGYIRDTCDYDFLRKKIRELVQHENEPEPSYWGETNNVIANVLDQYIASQSQRARHHQPARRTFRVSAPASAPAPNLQPPRAKPDTHTLVEKHATLGADLRSLRDNVEASQLACQDLQDQIKLARQAASAATVLNARKTIVSGLSSKLERVVYLNAEIQQVYTDMKPDDEKHYSRNKKDLARIESHLADLTAENSHLAAAIKSEAQHLEPLVPKAGLKEALAAYTAKMDQRWQAIAHDQASMAESKSLVKTLHASLEIGQRIFHELQYQYKQTLKADDLERLFDLRSHAKILMDLDLRHIDLTTDEKAIQTALNAVVPDPDGRLTPAHHAALAAIRIKIIVCREQSAALTTAIEAESAALDLIIPKKSLKKIDEVLQIVQRKKEQQLARQQEIASKHTKREKIARPKPPQKIAALKPLAKSTLAAKPEQKSSRPTTQPNQQRIEHLNQACKNLILIEKIMTVHRSVLTADVVHYALLYNIFRCFQSLRMYQLCGGKQRTINRDEVANLRHMIMHHGAGSAHPEAVEDFATELKTKLPQQLVAHTQDMLNRRDLDQNHRHMLIVAFDLVEPGLQYSPFLDHSMMVLEATPLYQKLAQFHDEKTHNDDAKHISERVLKTYIPLIKAILLPIIKGTGLDSDMKPENLFDTFGIQLQALRMLASICGEFAAHLHATLPDETGLQNFARFCRQEVRNKMGHDAIDLSDPELFFQQLKRSIAGIDATALLSTLNAPAKPAPSITSVSVFRHSAPLMKDKKAAASKPSSAKKR